LHVAESEEFEYLLGTVFGTRGPAVEPGKKIVQYPHPALRLPAKPDQSHDP
jgi:hypothetical protein